MPDPREHTADGPARENGRGSRADASGAGASGEVSRRRPDDATGPDRHAARGPARRRGPQTGPSRTASGPPDARPTGGPGTGDAAGSPRHDAAGRTADGEPVDEEDAVRHRPHQPGSDDPATAAAATGATTGPGQPEGSGRPQEAERHDGPDGPDGTGAPSGPAGPGAAGPADGAPGTGGPADAAAGPGAGPAAEPVAGPVTERAADPEAGERAERERRGGDRLRFVGAATRRVARGVDLDETVLGLCRASVPAYCDAILVYLRDPLPVGDERPANPVVLRLRRSDRIPEEQRPGGRLPLLGGTAEGAAEHVEVRAGGPLAEVLRGVRPVFADSDAASEALPELLGPGCQVPEGYRAILAPLRGRRRVIGAAVFLRRPERTCFEQDDLLIAAQLATHTALGVDKAVLYGREAYIADELQRTMLPDALPQPTGCTLASRYLPAAETARVGGDWYDAIPLPGSRVALVVGDVMGHSMTSAAIMGQLRTTAQTLAGLDLPPQEVLHHLDEQAQRLGSDRMATCLYAVYDPVAHRIVVANAGHPPPVMLHRGGRAEVLRIPAGAPIGVGGVDFEAVELDAPAGATLLLYTDGLVESRQRDVWTGIEFLKEKLTETARLTRPGTAPPLEPLCDEVLDILGPGDRDDDIALLAARFDGIAPSDVAYWYLDPRAQTAGQARRLVRRALSRWGLDELSDSLELLVSEVVTNAVRYAERPITLRLLRTDRLRCEVGDDVPQLPRLRQARATDEGGRGLYLVNRIARRWGATRLSTGKVVWFELSLPPGPSEGE
ncbi:SpoIIE family protein phosphatase [Streptomyces sp. JJ36]|nr:SpoIIE family protein phosphatase [Streptomyces sp. JJ36]